MAKHRSARQWASIIRSYRGSGLTQVEFCRRKGVALSTLTYHLRREQCAGSSLGCTGSESEGDPAPQLIELRVPAVKSPSLALAAEPVVIEVPGERGEFIRIHCASRQTGEVLRQISGLMLS